MNLKKSCLIFTAILTTASLIVISNSDAQTRTSEGISRQLTSLKNMMEAFANDMSPRMTNVENSVTNLETRENQRTACINTSGDPSIHWPTHPDADGRGCVSHDDMTGTTTATTNNDCRSQPIQWTGPYGSPQCSSTAWAASNGDSTVVTQTVSPQCAAGIVGEATITCRNGSFVVSNAICSRKGDGCK